MQERVYPRKFAAGEKVDKEDLNRLIELHALMSMHPDCASGNLYAEVADSFDDPVREACSAMSREKVYEMMDHAGFVQDVRRFFVLSEAFRDKMTIEEMQRENRIQQRALDNLGLPGSRTGQEMMEIMQMSIALDG